jgi:ATP-binding cassette subfamily B protein
MKPSGSFKEFTALTKVFFRGHEWNAACMFFFFLLKHSPVWVQPVVVGRLVDLARTEGKSEMEALIGYSAALLVLFAAHPFLHTLYVKFQSVIARRISMDFRIRICRRLQQMSLLLHNRTMMGRMHSKIIRDVEKIEDFPRMVTESFLQAAASLLITVVLILVRAPLTLLLFIVLVPVSVVLQRHFRPRIQQTYKDMRETIEGLSARLSDMMTMMQVTRAHGLERHELESVETTIEKVYAEGMKTDATNAWYISVSWASFMSCSVLFVACAVYLSFRGVLTAGDIVTFSSYFWMVAGSVLMFLNTLPIVAQVHESMVSVNEVLNSPDIEQNEGKRVLPAVSGRIEFRRVSYRYPGSDISAVRDLSFVIEPGKSVAFVGPSGCGKTTVLYLLLGFIRPSSGEILVDGCNVNELDMRTFRNHVGVVTQESVFFSGSIRENVAYGECAATDEEIVEALRKANAWDFVRHLPEGIHTAFGDRGVNFSGGQRQRIAIARALIREPRVLILDEATSALDVESEAVVQRALEQVMHNQTTIIVSHRLSIVRNVDVIYVMESGAITGSGTHEDLLSTDNTYAQFYRQSVG